MSDETIFTPAVIEALRAAEVEIVSGHGGWGDVTIEIRRGRVAAVYLNRLAAYVEGDKGEGK